MIVQGCQLCCMASHVFQSRQNTHNIVSAPVLSSSAVQLRQLAGGHTWILTIGIQDQKQDKAGN